MAKKKKTKGLQVTVDTSSIDEVKARIHKEAVSRASVLQQKFTTNFNMSLGTRKGLNSIMTKASNRGKVAADKAEKIAEQKKAEREARKQQKKK